MSSFSPSSGHAQQTWPPHAPLLTDPTLLPHIRHHPFIMQSSSLPFDLVTSSSTSGHSNSWQCPAPQQVTAQIDAPLQSTPGTYLPTDCQASGRAAGGCHVAAPCEELLEPARQATNQRDSWQGSRPQPVAAGETAPPATGAAASPASPAELSGGSSTAARWHEPGDVSRGVCGLTSRAPSAAPPVPEATGGTASLSPVGFSASGSGDARTANCTASRTASIATGRTANTTASPTTGTTASPTTGTTSSPTTSTTASPTTGTTASHTTAHYSRSTSTSTGISNIVGCATGVAGSASTSCSNGEAWLLQKQLREASLRPLRETDRKVSHAGHGDDKAP